MTNFIKFLRLAQRPINFILDVVGAALLVLLVLIITQEVFFRYVFNNPAKWSEELAIALLIWFGYLGITIGYRDNRHLCITFFFDQLPPAGQKVLDVFSDSVMLFFCLLMAHQGIQVTRLDVLNTMPATGVSMAWVSVVLVISGCTMALEGVIRILTRLFEPAPKVGMTGENAA